ncbi:MAG: ribonuclease D [Gammaproteobacteria bacterium]|nr:ribonuclease D [Gammaproteobacteria bacterium]
MSAPVLISDTASLADACKTLSKQGVVALDTEFVRVDTYYPKLCLLQLAAPKKIVLVDPLAVESLEPLRNMLLDPDVVKVLHAARQDFEVLYQIFGDLPQPVFDTQIGAAFRGLGDQLGYAYLVEQICGVTLSKSQTRTDWCARPLQEKQIAYAADDVRYLYELFLNLSGRLKRDGLSDWADEEMKSLLSVENYQTNPETAYLRIGAGKSLSPRNQHVLWALADWRERRAQQKNLPREWVVKERVLVEIAKRLPADKASLTAINGIGSKTADRWSKEILLIVKANQGIRNAKALWPALKRLTPGQKQITNDLFEQLQQRAAALGICASLLGPRRDISPLVTGDDSPLLHGWRYQAVGADLQKTMLKKTKPAKLF